MELKRTGPGGGGGRSPWRQIDSALPLLPGKYLRGFSHSLWQPFWFSKSHPRSSFPRSSRWFYTVLPIPSIIKVLAYVDFPRRSLWVHSPLLVIPPVQDCQLAPSSPGFVFDSSPNLLPSFASSQDSIPVPLWPITQSTGQTHPYSGPNFPLLPLPQ